MPDKRNVAKLFCVKSPNFARCKEGDLPLLNFSDLMCIINYKFILLAEEEHLSFLLRQNNNSLPKGTRMAALKAMNVSPADHSNLELP